MQPEKKQLETLLMHYFRECNPDFPKGKVMPSESPDFVLMLKTRNKIGIELTRLNPHNALSPDLNGLEQQKVRDQIITTAKSLFENSSSLKLFVKFLFTDNMPIKDERVLSVSVQSAQAIRLAVQHKTPADFFHLTIDRKYLPGGLDEILIIHHPTMEVSVWERSNNLGISEDVLGDITEAITKKDEKLRLYHRQSLNYYWLIIVADRLRGAKSYNLNNRIRNHVFSSRFQNVFLFDLIKSDVLQLV